MRKILTLSSILGLIILASCSGPEQQMTPKQNWTPKLNQPSELALIMRDMHEESTNRKNSLEQGQLDPTLSETLFSMITAHPTKPHMKGEGFEPYAKSFIGIYNQIHGAKEVGVQIQAHNNMVDACIACHTKFCDGPISRIEKLYVR
tara:strand:- start:1968 stop:2408 length:441 start_codon:yes stop_codon:yes gene_type:complete